uniref:Uncharacterized protein n=1 Tax=Myotis myotis TaxID=51298 RepID=A0A7J7Z4C5_MYOMY|nr:hypothetical protein mMyoMyo1_010528 [Myotis myotis]
MLPLSVQATVVGDPPRSGCFSSFLPFHRQLLQLWILLQASRSPVLKEAFCFVLMKTRERFLLRFVTGSLKSFQCFTITEKSREQLEKNLRKQLFPKPSLIDDPKEVKRLNNFNHPWHSDEGLQRHPRERGRGSGTGTPGPHSCFIQSSSARICFTCQLT